MQQRPSVYSLLSSSPRAERLGGLDLGAGKSAAIWRNSFDRMRYERPDGHTFSLYLRGGESTWRLDAGRAHGWPGALCLMPQGASSDWEINDTFEFVHLYVTDDELRRQFSETLDRDARLMTVPEATFDDAPRLAESLRCLAVATQARETLRAEEAIATAIACLFSDPRYGGARLVSLRGGLSPVVRRRLIDYIEARLEHVITLQELAGVAGLSEFHLQRMFRQSCGVSPYGFILNRRIDRARRMLADGDPIAEIASACGFSSQSHMTRMFKAVTGTTPSAYRRSVA